MNKIRLSRKEWRGVKRGVLLRHFKAMPKDRIVYLAVQTYSHTVDHINYSPHYIVQPAKRTFYEAEGLAAYPIIERALECQQYLGLEALLESNTDERVFVRLRTSVYSELTKTAYSLTEILFGYRKD